MNAVNKDLLPPSAALALKVRRNVEVLSVRVSQIVFVGLFLVINTPD